MLAGGIQWTWKDAKNGSYRTFQKERAEEIQKKISNTDLELVSVDRKPKKTMAPGLYDLTTLQREANPEIWIFRKKKHSISCRDYMRIIRCYVSENGFPLYRQGCCPDDQRETESLWNRPISKTCRCAAY